MYLLNVSHHQRGIDANNLYEGIKQIKGSQESPMMIGITNKSLHFTDMYQRRVEHAILEQLLH